MNETKSSCVLDKLKRMDWVPAEGVPDHLSKLSWLTKIQRPFAVIVTGPAELTVDIADQAHAAKIISVPIALSYRPPDEAQLLTDLGLILFSKTSDESATQPLPVDTLLPFALEALKRIDGRAALIAGTKRSGKIDQDGAFHNSFKTEKLTPLLMRRYLGRLHGKHYCLLEFSSELAGCMSRWSWDCRSAAPAILYTPQATSFYREEFGHNFEFGNFSFL